MKQPVQVIEDPGDQLFVTRHRPVASEADMDITPMIDITFLLLIFFLVATRMDAQGAVELPEAQHGTAVSSKNAAIITVARGDGDQALIYKGDGRNPANLVTAVDLRDQEQEIADYVQAELTAVIPKQHVLVKAEREVKHREVARVATAVGEIPGVQLYVAVLEVQ